MIVQGLLMESHHHMFFFSQIAPFVNIDNYVQGQSNPTFEDSLIFKEVNLLSFG